jgi:DNA modification methylase
VTYYQDDWLTVLLGDCREVMASMEPESVHCVVTSPPYWGLRDYGSPGQLGLEPTPEAYVESMVAVFREVRRVLRSDGTVWLNLGDSYAGGGTIGRNDTDPESLARRAAEGTARYGKGAGRGTGSQVGNHGTRPPVAGLKPKDLVGIPWRVAFALQADGWYLRSDIIWSKPNPMPESVTDRPTKSHEYLFLLSKSPRYYWDADAVRENYTGHATGPGGYLGPVDTPKVVRERNDNGRTVGNGDGAGRNIRSVWTIATQPYPGAHFATFPQALVEPCIKAGTSERGVCPECGAPWERMVEAAKYEPAVVEVGVRNVDASRGDKVRKLDGKSAEWRAAAASRATAGWRPSCDHAAIPVPATVLDPFAGSGTVGLVAQRLSRRAVLIDLNADYLGQVMDRNRDIPLGLGA